MGLGSIVGALETIGALLGGAQGIGTALALAGFLILLIMGAGFLVWLTVKLIRQIPHMTPGEFLKFMLVLAIGLIAAGAVLP